MRNTFLDQLDRWIVTVLHERLTDATPGVEPEMVTAAHLAEMISDYVLLGIAEQPNACWTACEIDHVSDEEIMAATTFSDGSLAAAFIGAVCDLSAWETDEGIDLMISHGVSPDDAREIAAAIEVATGKLGARGQAIIQRLGAGEAAGKAR